MDERTAWNRRYAEGEYVPRTAPAPFLEAWIDRFPPGRALDVACGTGRNALRLAAAGFEVDAVDISDVAIETARDEAGRHGLDVQWHVAAMDDYEIPAASYEVITVIRYRNPALWPRLIEGLTPDGWILVEHHFKSTVEVRGPSTADFRLDAGELLNAFGGLRVLFYAEGLETADIDDGQYALARMVACKGDPGF